MQSVILPLGAHVPPEWVLSRTLFETKISFPSWTTERPHILTIQEEDRRLTCDCEAFRYRGDCHHVQGLRWATSRPVKRHGVQRTSIEAFRAFSEDELSDRQQHVLACLRTGGPASNREIAERIHWPINCVTPRVLELRERGLVENVGVRVNSSGRNEHVWGSV